MKLSNKQNLIEEKAEDKDLKKILVVENEESNADVLLYYLKNHFDVTLAVNSDEALNILENHNFDLILMDINLGFGMNGVELTKHLRSIARFKDIPIIAVTAYALSGDKIYFLSAGCTDYISKPFNQNELLNIISKYLK